MKLNHIRDVIAIADYGSLRAAAQHLGLAQPALTRSIRELERELSVDLFERHARGMALTQLGEAFISRMRVIQAEIQRSREEVEQMSGRMVGHVSVGFSMVAAIALLPTVVEQFKRRFPDVYLKVVEGLFPDLRVPITDGTLDFYVGPIVDRPVPRALTTENLLGGELVILCRRGHPLRTVRSFADLADASWTRFSVADSRRLDLAPFFRQHGLAPPKIGIEVSSALAAFIVTAHTDLLAMLPRQFTRHPGVADLLERIKVREKLEAPPICLVRRSRLPLTPAAEFLCDLIRRAAARENRRPSEAR
jgi:LysR family transcriptional regulator of abg operon